MAKNPDIVRAYNKKYYAENRVKQLERQKKYRTENPEKAKEWAAKNPEKIKATAIRWRTLNPEKSREKVARYREAHPERIAAYFLANLDRDRQRKAVYKSANRVLYTAIESKRRAAKQSAVPAWADLDAIKTVYMEANYRQMQVDHIVPLKSKLVCGLHVLENLQLLSMKDNAAKGNRHWPDMPL